jgi:hypothetical protein
MSCVTCNVNEKCCLWHLLKLKIEEASNILKLFSLSNVAEI